VLHGCTKALKDKTYEKGHPEHIRSLASMPSGYTVNPEHKSLLLLVVIIGFFLGKAFKN
jgi:hypothetical protein